MFAMIYNKKDIEVISGNLYYHGSVRKLTQSIKRSDRESILLAAWAMRQWVDDWSNVALVPMPSHFGFATYTLGIAKAIGKGEVYDILRCKMRDTLYGMKKSGKKVSTEDIGMYAIGRVPEGKRIIYIDNVVATGTTAQAAIEKVGKGSVLSFSFAKIC